DERLHRDRRPPIGQHRPTIGCKSAGSDNTLSNAAKALGSSFTPTANDSSHKHSGRSANSVNTQTPSDQKTHYLQGTLALTPDGTTTSHRHPAKRPGHPQ